MKTQHLNISVDTLTQEDYGSYYGIYIGLIPEGMLLSEALDPKNAPLIDLASGLTEEQALHRYAPDKWSIKEVIMHLIDCERIFNYRALRYARQDKTNLMGFDQDDFVTYSDADQLPLDQLLETFLLQQKNSEAMFQTFTPDMLNATGIANDYEMSVRALGFFYLAHEIHHTNIIKERYLG